MTERAVVYEDFSKGEYGNLGGREAGKRDKGYFHAKNMVRYRNGLLGPRAGLKALPISGITNGVVWGIGFNGTPAWDLWIVMNDTIYSAISSGGVFTSKLVMGATPNRPIVGLESQLSTSHIVNSGDKVYQLNHLAGTAAAISGSPNGDAIAVYSDRLFVAGRDSSRLYYSAAVDWTSWPALNYFDVGQGPAVRALFAQRGHLAIGLQNGEWWNYNGAPGTTDVLRRTTGGGEHPWVFSQNGSALLSSDDIVGFKVASDFPATFDAAQVHEERHLSLVDATGVAYDDFGEAVATKGHRSDEAVLILPEYKRMVHKRNGVWTFHTFEDLVEPKFACSDGQGRILMSSPGASGAPPAFYVYQLNLERPAIEGDSNARPGDLSSDPLDAWVSMPEEWADDGHELKVRTVIVDFYKWDINATQNNYFECEVEALNLFDASATRWSAAQAWEEAGDGETGKRYRHKFNFGDQGSGAGFQVHLSEIRGIAIERVTVLVDDVEQRHG